MDISVLQQSRYGYKPKLPPVLAGNIDDIAIDFKQNTAALEDSDKLAAIFPDSYGKAVASFVKGKGKIRRDAMRIGVILSGGQAPGGHNVIAGLLDGLKTGNQLSSLIGFRGGPGGLVDNKSIELSPEFTAAYRNTGGFDIIGSGRTKIESREQFEKSAATVAAQKLDALVIIGGDDSNTNAAMLAEYFKQEKILCTVIGVPKTIDGDLKNEFIEASFGFDTAAKTYSELIGNIERDAASAKKYWHFIRLMGRSASHISLECALQTRPNIALVSEEVEAKKQTLSEITEEICASIVARAEKGMNFGVVLIPEGLIEFIPEFKLLISELNELLAAKEAPIKEAANDEERLSFITDSLSKAAAALYKSLPSGIAKQLVKDRDPHGNVMVSQIDTEKLLIAMAEKRLAEMKAQGSYKGSFSPLGHFFGYEGRSAFPSNFDADYCYALGYSAFVLAASYLSGYIVSIRGLAFPSNKWIAGGIPIVSMMNIERRHGKDKAVIKKALVDLNGAPFKAFAAMRQNLSTDTMYRFPGAIQYFGPSELCDRPTETLLLEHGQQ
ncbi:diphosphate--fructose-6-phosphate 1-phosphotransferase [Spirochaetota bacterium]